MANFLGVVTNVFEAVDIITLIKGNNYDELNLDVGEALKKRADVRLAKAFSLEHIVLISASGLSGNLHMLNQRPFRYHLRHDKKVEGSSTYCH